MRKYINQVEKKLNYTENLIMAIQKNMIKKLFIDIMRINNMMKFKMRFIDIWVY